MSGIRNTSFQNGKLCHSYAITFAAQISKFGIDSNAGYFLCDKKEIWATNLRQYNFLNRRKRCAGFKRSVHWPLLPKRRMRFCYVIIRATLNSLRMPRGASLKNSNYEAVMLWRVDQGEEGKNTTKDCNLYGYRNRGAKMTTGAQGITLRGSAELVADFFCKHFCGCLRCSCFPS